MTVSEFLSMGGYGFYIWASYLVSAVVLAGEVFSVRRRFLHAVEQVQESAP